MRSWNGGQKEYGFSGSSVTSPSAGLVARRVSSTVRRPTVRRFKWGLESYLKKVLYARLCFLTIHRITYTHIHVEILLFYLFVLLSTNDMYSHSP
jgi:hypothetical protein